MLSITPRHGGHLGVCTCTHHRRDTETNSSRLFPLVRGRKQRLLRTDVNRTKLLSMELLIPVIYKAGSCVRNVLTMSYRIKTAVRIYILFRIQIYLYKYVAHTHTNMH